MVKDTLANDNKKRDAQGKTRKSEELTNELDGTSSLLDFLPIPARGSISKFYSMVAINILCSFRDKPCLDDERLVGR
jgi:hypothetical protein